MKCADLAGQIRQGNIRAMGKGITLIESKKPEHIQQATELLDMLLPFSGHSLRIGITGVPGFRYDCPAIQQQQRFDDDQCYSVCHIGCVAHDRFGDGDYRQS